MTTVIIIVGGIAAAAIVGSLLSRKKDDKKKAQKKAVSGANVTNDITRVGKGGVFQLPKFGPHKLSIETYVTAKHKYKDEEGDVWYELVCQHGKRDLLVEWYHEGRELVVTAGYEDENPSLDDLGLDEDSLTEMDEEEEGNFRWDGTKFHYEDSGEVRYYEHGKPPPETYYCWDFEDDSETRFISVEKWEGERKFKVYHLWEVDADDIEVYDAGQS